MNLIMHTICAKAKSYMMLNHTQPKLKLLQRQPCLYFPAILCCCWFGFFNLDNIENGNKFYIKNNLNEIKQKQRKPHLTIYFIPKLI